MSSPILDTTTYQKLILLLYSETFPYTSLSPNGITLPLFSKECEKHKVDLHWRSKYWNKGLLTRDTILIYIGENNRNVRYFTKGLRNAFAHCNISISDGMVYAKCHQKYENGKTNGRKIFEVLISVDKLIDILTFIKETKS